MSNNTTTPAPEVPALRQLVLRHAIEHGAARWAAVPGVGRGGAARYIWETEGRRDRDELEWVVTYLAEHPEVFDLPLDGGTVTLAERRRELADAADKAAMAAWKAGDLAGALALVDQAEALHPNPGSFYDRARKVLTEQAAAKPADEKPEPDQEPDDEPADTGDVDEWEALAAELGGVA